MSLLDPSGVSPPNNTALSLVSDVKVKKLTGGRVPPLIVGDSHSPKDNLYNFLQPDDLIQIAMQLVYHKEWIL